VELDSPFIFIYISLLGVPSNWGKASLAPFFLKLGKSISGTFFLASQESSKSRRAALVSVPGAVRCLTPGGSKGGDRLLHDGSQGGDVLARPLASRPVLHLQQPALLEHHEDHPE